MKKSFLFFSVLALAFAGCGDSSSSSDDAASSGIIEAESFDDLVHCTRSHYGEIAHVVETDSVYECTEDGWMAADSSVVEEALSAKSSSSRVNSSSSVKANAEDVEKIDVRKVDSVAVEGFAELGPFVNGSSVTVYGLDSALATNSTKFTGKTEGDSGRYNISKVSLNSQYALVEVSGFYKNLLTGKKTSGTKSRIRAIVDLSSGKSVEANVNLFTELEFARVKTLVLKDGFNVPAAKKRATQELLSVFGTSEKDLVSTSVSLSDSGAVLSAYLGALVMLQGDLSVSKFKERLGDFADDFAEDGSWDDAEIRTAVADYLADADGKDGFAAIRSNMETTIAKVPAFENFLTEFWTSELGLGECTDSLETTISTVTNKNSLFFPKGFACTSKRWHLSTELDTELGLCTAKMDGEFKESKLEKTLTYFTCNDGEWKEISKTAYELKSCTAERENEYVKAESGEMFVCLDKQWKEIDAITYELKFCTESRNEKVEKTKAGKFYACYNEEWIEVEEIDSEIGYPCVENGLNNREKVDGKFYRCDGEKWTEISEDMYEIGLCNAKLVGTCEKGVSGKYYQCVENDGFSWADYDEISCKIGECDKSMEDQNVAYKGDGYYCDGNAWNVCNSSSVNTLSGNLACVDSTEGTEHFYAWRKASEKEKIAGGVCSESRKISTGRDSEWTYYDDGKKALYCVDECDYLPCQVEHLYVWTEASGDELKAGARCQSNTEGSVKNGLACEKFGVHEYDYGWREADLFEKEVGLVCQKSIEEPQKSVGGKTYTCRSNTNGTRYFWTLSVSDSRTKAVKKSYEAVAIGNQVWLNSNLNYSSSATYAADDASGSKYGAFYSYGATRSGNDLCPTGWKMPSKSDVEQLQKYLSDNSLNVVSALLDSSRAFGENKNYDGTNDYGFGGLGTGEIYDCSYATAQLFPDMCGGGVLKLGTTEFWVVFEPDSDYDSATYAYYGSISGGKVSVSTMGRTEKKTTSGGSTQVSFVPSLKPVRCILK